MPEKPIVDGQLVQYLLGTLPEEEAERLDELSVVDDEFAARLMAVENDLVDSYARNELSGQTLERFKSFYLSSTKRQEKARFANTLLILEQKTSALKAAPARTEERAKSSEGLSFFGSLRRFFAVPHLTLQWGLAAVVLVFAVASGSLILQERRLRDQLAQAQAERAALEQRKKELDGQLAQQHTADAQTLDELQQLRQSIAHLRQQGRPMSELSIASFVLLPAMRGGGQLPVLAVPKGTDEVVLRLELEGEGFPRYRVALRDPVAGQTVWRSGKLRATSSGGGKAVAVALPADLLRSGNYHLELTGILKQNEAEPLSSYGFKVVLE